MKRIISLFLVIILLLSVGVFGASALTAPYFYGDVDISGSIDVVDATLIMRNCALLTEFDDLSHELADFDGNSEVNIVDATRIQQYNAQLITRPREDNYYIHSLVKINSVTPSKPSKHVDITDVVTFSVDAEIKYPVADVGELRYDYLIVDISDKTQILFENMGSEFQYTFDESGLYRIDVIVTNDFNESDKYILQYEVVESYPYDEYMFVSFEEKYRSDYQYNGFPQMPLNCDINFETIFSKSTIYNLKDYVANIDGLGSEFATVITSKEQYDTFVYVDNEELDDEYFETYSLVAVYTSLSCHQAEGRMDALAVDGDTMYINIGEYIDIPDGMGVSPTTPGCVLIARVNKADVENVTDIEWANKNYN